MKAHGFCMLCKRIKMVRVSPAAMTKKSKAPFGICDACQHGEVKRIK